MMTTLAQMLQAYTQKYDCIDADIARSIGISKSTFSRLKQGKQPDAHTLIKLNIWMLKV